MQNLLTVLYLNINLACVQQSRANKGINKIWYRQKSVTRRDRLWCCVEKESPVHNGTDGYEWAATPRPFKVTYSRPHRVAMWTGLLIFLSTVRHLPSSIPDSDPKIHKLIIAFATIFGSVTFSLFSRVQYLWYRLALYGNF